MACEGAAANGRNAIKTDLTGKGAEEWRQGWPLVMATTIGFAISQSNSYAMGVMIEPLQQEFGWSRAEATSGMAITASLALVASPLAGVLVDRFGARTIGLIGTLGYLLGVAMLSLAGPNLWMWWGLWLIFGLFATLNKPATWSAAVSSRFFEQRALALGILFSSSGLASATVPTLAQALISAYGWRAGYLGISAFGLVVALPLLWFFLHDARSRAPPRKADEKKVVSANVYTGLGAREAMLSSQFLRLALTGAIMAGLTVSLTVHFVPMLVEGGYSRMAAAGTTAFLGSGAIVAHIVTGVLLDRYHGPRIGALTFLIPVPACMMLLALGSAPWLGVPAAMILGFGTGAQSGVLAYLATRYFGLKNFGAIYGTIIGIMSTGGIWPTLVGFVYDTTGSYQTVLQMVAPLYIVCAAMIITLGAYPNFASSLDEPGQA